MPHRDTVAGEAALRASVSNKIFVQSDKSTISELGRHSFLESSNTEFMLSIQSESTGPSKIIHWFICVATSSSASLKMIGTSPLEYSFVIWFICPYMFSFRIALGFSTRLTTFLKGFSLSSSSVELVTSIAILFMACSSNW